MPTWIVPPLRDRTDLSIRSFPSAAPPPSFRSIARVGEDPGGVCMTPPGRCRSAPALLTDTSITTPEVSYEDKI